MHDRMFGGTLARVSAALMTACALAFGAVACGDDDGDETPAAEESVTTTEESTATEEGESAEAVTLTAVEYEFDLSATPTADTTTVTFDNQGKEPHVLIYAKINDGFTTEEAIKMEGENGSAETIAEADAAPGKSVEVEITKPVEPGNYAMLCPIGGPKGAHWELGQLEEFEIG